ncbi:argininosuccinate lyase [Marinilabiliaceae bacterium ANBcel2]|nr:argininosuccinate lyase [Marinilabiliaceae bacterium ANBcel2]
MKLWDKGGNTNKKIEEFTTGKDRELDTDLAAWDIAGTIAHITMLKKTELLSQSDYDQLIPELKTLYKRAVKGEFIIEEGVEDIHSQVEMLLTQKLGDIGKKVHSGRSRNDQVLLDLRLYTREEIKNITTLTKTFFNTLQQKSEKHKDDLLPGYTHLQVAMPSSFGLWFGAYAESLTDDMHLLYAAWTTANQNPLGTAAGYGSSFPLDRELTTKLLGFDEMSYNVIYAQMGRGKTERNVAMAIASIASTISKFAMDACLYMSQNFAFISLPDELTTGSSIMPHKKNPDIFELLRAKCNRLQALPQDIMMITSNLPSGYFRDLQLIKELYIPALKEIKSCIEIAEFGAKNIIVTKDIMKNPAYKYAFSVEEVNNRVIKGVPFREAYREVGKEIEKGEFKAPSNISHTHHGSIGNLCNKEISKKMDNILNQFSFNKMEKAINSLIT